MNHLDRKLFRDLLKIKSQAVAVALVMACGIAMLVNMRSLIRSLDTARDGYYTRHHFARVFSSLKRAPGSLRDRLAAIPGVAAVETGISRLVTLDVPGQVEPATGSFSSLPDRQDPVLNIPFLRSGRLPRDAGRHTVLVGEAFAEAHGLGPGDKISALLNGRKIELRVSGVALAPQFVFEAPPRSALPDNRTFGVFWMNEEELAEAYSMKGAFNEVAMDLSPGANEREVIAEADRLLKPYGGLGAYGRSEHPSDVRLSDEIHVLRGLSVGFPVVFLSVAAFMIHSVLARQITLQREQIAILKAFGFSDRAIAGHFLKFSLVIVLLGAVLGSVAGIWLGHRLVEMYHLFFRFPRLEFVLSWPALVASVLVTSLSALAGVFGAARRIMRMTPAMGMRPEPPASYRPAMVERLPWTRSFPVAFRMAFRNLERNGWRSVLSCVALALATGILIIPGSFRDGIGHILDFQWDVIQRQTASVGLVEAAGPEAISDFRTLPGVTLAEPYRSVPVELVAGHHQRRLVLTGLKSGSVLQQITSGGYRTMAIPKNGVVVSKILSRSLGIKAGDRILVRSLSGKRTEKFVFVSGLAEDFAGIAAYMELDALNRMMDEGDRVDGASLLVASSGWERFLQAVKRTPQASGVVIKSALRDSFRKTTAESIGLIQTMYLIFATVVASGIVYNSTRISLSERSRELATLRVLGFGRREVGATLVIEISILTAAAIPLGLIFGSVMASVLLQSVNTETVRLPLVLTLGNYTIAIAVIVMATVASVSVACRNLAKIDLVQALKSPD